jgi:hypothetical protein
VPIADWADTEDNKPYVVLQWYGSTDAVVYVVELFANAVWNNQGTIKNEGQFLFKFTSAILGDATEPLFRVSAVNELMQTSTPVEIVKKVITCPLFRHSEISIGYDGSDLIIAQGV